MNGLLIMVVTGFAIWLGAKCLLKKIYKYNPTLQKTTYEDKLQDPRWKTKRDKIIARDNYKCQWCGKTINLQVHHKAYHKFPNETKVEPWDYPDRLLITLCDDCHKKCHQKYKIHTFYRKWGEHYE